MSLLNICLGIFNKLTLFFLLVSISIPIYYGSTNHEYVQIRFLHSMISWKHYFTTDPFRPSLSAEYRAFEDILRQRPMAELDPLADPLVVANASRLAFTLGHIIPKPSRCNINQETFEHDGQTVETYWVDYHRQSFQRNSDKILLFFHGGGYMLGDIDSYSGFECHLSQLFNIIILHLEYRLCPEYPLPAAVDDAVTLYQALLNDNISPSQLMFMGDASGGGLSLLTIQALIARQLPTPCGVIALSPWTDLSASSESYKRNRLTDLMLRIENTNWMVPHITDYNQTELSADNPIFSPLFGSFKDFPPMYINVGTAEITEDDSRRVVQKAEEAGIDVTFEAGLHLMHAYPMFFIYYPEARYTLDNINNWMHTIFDQKLNE